MATIDFAELLRQALAGTGGIIPTPTPRPDPATTGSTTPAINVAGASQPAAPEKPSFFQNLFHPDEETRDERRDFLMSLGAGMLQSGAPSLDPSHSSLLGGVGNGLALAVQNSAANSKERLEARKLKASQQAQQQAQDFAAGLGGGGSGEPTDPDTNYSLSDLKKLHQYYIAHNELSAANGILDKIQRLEDSLAQKGLVRGPDGKFSNAPGVVEAETQEEFGKAAGRTAGEESVKQTDDIREYNKYVEQEKAAGRTPLDLDPWMKGQKAAGSTQVNVNSGPNSKKFDDKADEKAADRYDGYAADGVNANQMISDMQQLVDLGRQFRNGATADWTLKIGPYAQAVGIDIDGLGPIQAYNAITSRIAPQMRQPGSGANSDLDVKMFFASIPNLQNTAEGNQIIADTMTAVASNKVAVAEIANRVFNKEITWQQGDKEIAKLENPYARFKQFQKDRLKIGGVDRPAPEEKPKPDLAGGVSSAPAEEAPIAPPTVNTPEEARGLPANVEFFYYDPGDGSGLKRKKNPNYKK